MAFYPVTDQVHGGARERQRTFSASRVAGPVRQNPLHRRQALHRECPSLHASLHRGFRSLYLAIVYLVAPRCALIRFPCRPASFLLHLTHATICAAVLRATCSPLRGACP